MTPIFTQSFKSHGTSPKIQFTKYRYWYSMASALGSAISLGQIPVQGAVPVSSLVVFFMTLMYSMNPFLHPLKNRGLLFQKKPIRYGTTGTPGLVLVSPLTSDVVFFMTITRYTYVHDDPPHPHSPRRCLPSSKSRITPGLAPGSTSASMADSS